MQPSTLCPSRKAWHGRMMLSSCAPMTMPTRTHIPSTSGVSARTALLALEAQPYRALEVVCYDLPLLEDLNHALCRQLPRCHPRRLHERPPAGRPQPARGLAGSAGSAACPRPQDVQDLGFEGGDDLSRGGVSAVGGRACWQAVGCRGLNVRSGLAQGVRSKLRCNAAAVAWCPLEFLALPLATFVRPGARAPHPRAAPFHPARPVAPWPHQKWRPASCNWGCTLNC